MTVYRIHIRPKGGKADPELSFRYCVDNAVLGMGWEVGDLRRDVTWDEYETKGIEKYGAKELSRVRYLKKNAREGDLIWTRDTLGNYYLGRVKSEWEYSHSDESVAADVVNFVRCYDLIDVRVDDIPGKVVASFRPTRTIQAIRSETVSEYSRYLWNKLSKTDHYPMCSDPSGDIFTFLGSEETEDVICIYLQLNGWVIVPNSRKADTMGYEFYLIHKTAQERAVVQVKTGNTSLVPSRWQGQKEKVFLFQANGRYEGPATDNVTCIDPAEIESFMFNNRDLLPGSITRWLDIIEMGAL